MFPGQFSCFLFVFLFLFYFIIFSFVLPRYTAEELLEYDPRHVRTVNSIAILMEAKGEGFFVLLFSCRFWKKKNSFPRKCRQSRGEEERAITDDICHSGEDHRWIRPENCQAESDGTKLFRLKHAQKLGSDNGLFIGRRSGVHLAGNLWN